MFFTQGKLEIPKKGELEKSSLGTYIRLEAKPGMENDVGAFLMQGVELADLEATTPLWFALRFGPSTFAVFDAFADESGRQAHLDGRITKFLMANASDLLATPLSIEKADIMGAKISEEVRNAD